MLDSTDNYIIDEYFNQKEIVRKNDYDVKFIKIGNQRNISGYILVKCNIESVDLSKRRKKKKTFYSEVVFCGLRQPTKEINKSTYSVLSNFIKRFKVSDLDICFDGLSEIAINSKNINQYYYMFNEYINNFSKDTEIIKSSFYINTPSSPNDDTDYFKKICVYDKFIKESKHKKIDPRYTNWKRLEVTVNVHFKFNGFVIDDYIEDIKRTAKSYFNTSNFSYEYLDLQCKLLTDRRTLHRKNIEL